MKKGKSVEDGLVAQVYMPSCQSISSRQSIYQVTTISILRAAFPGSCHSSPSAETALPEAWCFSAT